MSRGSRAPRPRGTTALSAGHAPSRVWPRRATHVPSDRRGRRSTGGGACPGPVWQHHRCFRPRPSASAAGSPHTPHSIQMWSGSPGQGLGSLASNIRRGLSWDSPELCPTSGHTQVCSALCLSASPRQDKELPKHWEITVVKYHHSPNRCHLTCRMGPPPDTAVPRFSVRTGRVAAGASRELLRAQDGPCDAR